LSAFLDTNVLIRHLTGDPPAQARRASALLATADELLVPDLIVAEVAYVLESFYDVERERVAELVRAVIGFPVVVVIDAPLLLRTGDLRARPSRLRRGVSRRERRGEWSRQDRVT
jgi:predicted nucleic acid-binding protein